MIPNARPGASRETVVAALKKRWDADRPGEAFPDVVVGFVRGYFFRTMGDPAKNDRGIYDDAAVLIEPGSYRTYNANSDPTAGYRKGVATLLPGCYPYRPGNHGISRPGGGYPAFRPATPGEALPVKRDGESAVPSKRPGVAINIHKGGFSTTSSEGCQTIHPTQWAQFHAHVTAAINRAKIQRFWVIVVDGPIN